MASSLDHNDKDRQRLCALKHHQFICRIGPSWVDRDGDRAGRPRVDQRQVRLVPSLAGLAKVRFFRVWVLCDGENVARNNGAHDEAPAISAVAWRIVKGALHFGTEVHPFPKAAKVVGGRRAEALLADAER